MAGSGITPSAGPSTLLYRNFHQSNIPHLVCIKQSGGSSHGYDTRWKLATASIFGRIAIMHLDADFGRVSGLSALSSSDSLVLHVLEAALCVLSMVDYQPMLQLAASTSSQDTMFNSLRVSVKLNPIGMCVISHGFCYPGDPYVTLNTYSLAEPASISYLQKNS